MCGRYSQATPVEQLADLFSLAGAPQPKPRYNIAPSQQVAVIPLNPRRWVATAGPPALGFHSCVGEGPGRRVRLGCGVTDRWPVRGLDLSA